MEVQESGQCQINLVVLLRNVDRQLVLESVVLFNKLLDLFGCTPVHLLKFVVLGGQLDHLLVPLLAVTSCSLCVFLLLHYFLLTAFDLVLEVGDCILLGRNLGLQLPDLALVLLRGVLHCLYFGLVLLDSLVIRDVALVELADLILKLFDLALQLDNSLCLLESLLLSRFIQVLVLG